MNGLALGALAVVLVGTAPGHASNAGITWASGGVIRGANIDGSRRHVVVPFYADDEGDPAWTRDGRALAYFARFSDTVELVVRWPKTRRLRVLGHSRSSEPTWSPDAKRIAVSEAWGSFNSSNPAATIRVVSVATDKLTSATKPRPHRIDMDPSWSPDGRTIAFARQDNGGTPTLYLVRADGRSLRRLTKGRSPSWSPDGKRLAFALGHSIYEIRADGRGRKRILSGLRNPLVRWSPDGAKLLYTHGAVLGEADDAWVSNADGTHRTRVIHERYGIEGIAWRPG